MEFIGRKGELSKLHAEYSRDSSFVVIYGRRRVGKSTLIKVFEGKNSILFSCHRGIGKPEHEAAGRCYRPYNEKHAAAESRIYRLAGSVPRHC